MRLTQYNAPEAEVVEVNIERGFADSYGEEGEAGQDMGIYDQGSF